MRSALRTIITTPLSIIPTHLKQNCFAWWDARKSNYNDATKILDISGNNRHMTLYNVAGTAADGWNPERPAFLQTDGVDSYGRYEGIINPTQTSFSIVAAISVHNLSGYKFLVYGNSDSTPGLSMSLNNHTLYAVMANATTGSTVVSLANALQANKMYIIAATYDQRDTKVRMYINGAFINASATSPGNREVNSATMSISHAMTWTTKQRTSFYGIFPNYAFSLSDVQAICKSNRGCMT